MNRPHYQANETIYERFIPYLEQTCSLRVADPQKDLERFHNWHHQNRVAHFWELALTREELHAYLEKLLHSPFQDPLIVEFNHQPVGYVESYWVIDDRLAPYYDCTPFDRGFHFLIGEKMGLGFLRTDTVLLSVCDFLFQADPCTHRIMAEPRVDNKLLLRYLERFPSWRKLKEFDFPHKRAALLECTRDRFYELENMNERPS